MDVIKRITDVIEAVDGVKLLDVDPGAATNRTVVTFVGEPEPVIEAAFQAVKFAGEIIDMRKHSGEHPRFGATDVCPLVPISGITMEETVKYAHKLGKRIGEETNIPVYFYEHAAKEEKRRNLANIRVGEYEGIAEKILNPEWAPDAGKAVFNPQTGNVAVSARNFLVAYNVNLNTTSTRRANSVAFDVRENGRVKRIGDPIVGEIATDENGETIRIPGKLKSVKAIGWYIEEYGIAQISMNLTDVTITKVHEAYEAVYESCNERGLRVTGSELVGLIPFQALFDAGVYFLKKQNRSIGISESEIIKIAVKSLGLDELAPFDPNKKIIEYMLEGDGANPLVNMTLSDFADETASESPAPGGGSISAYVGALGISLGTMVANLSSHKRGWDDRWEEFSDWAQKGQRLKHELLHLVDEDTAAFNKIMDSFKLPKNSAEEKAARKQAIQDATKYAIEVPLTVMRKSYDTFEVIKAMAEIGNPNSVSDAGVGALCARTAVMGAWLNVKINAADLKDQEFLDSVLGEAAEIAKKTEVAETEVLAAVEAKIAG